MISLRILSRAAHSAGMNKLLRRLIRPYTKRNGIYFHIPGAPTKGLFPGVNNCYVTWVCFMRRRGGSLGEQRTINKEAEVLLPQLYSYWDGGTELGIPSKS
jgi:hypothetical protein